MLLVTQPAAVRDQIDKSGPMRHSMLAGAACKRAISHADAYTPHRAWGRARRSGNRELSAPRATSRSMRQGACLNCTLTENVSPTGLPQAATFAVI